MNNLNRFAVLAIIFGVWAMAYDTGRQQPACTLSPELQAFLGGVETMPRTQVVKAIWAYIKAHDLPPHPLTEIGYYSIGCEPCTQAGGTAADPRAGRWAGTAKTECGIHWTHNGEAIAAPSGAAH